MLNGDVLLKFKLRKVCGEKGIRTLGTRKSTTVFETAPFDRSGISPGDMGCKCIHFIGKNKYLHKFQLLIIFNRKVEIKACSFTGNS